MQALNQLVMTYVADHPNSRVVLPRLWHTSPPVVLAAMVSLHSTDSTTVIRSLEILQVRACSVTPELHQCGCVLAGHVEGRLPTSGPLHAFACHLSTCVSFRPNYCYTCM